MTPTPSAVGYEAAAFYRFRAPYGADQDKRIEWNPSWQWEGYGYGAVFVLLTGKETQHEAAAKIGLAHSRGNVA